MTSKNKTRIAFLQRDVHESLGVMLLCACLKREGHDAEVFINSFERDIIERTAVYNPDIVCFNVLTGEHPWHIETARAVKTVLPTAWTACGGPHPTFFPRFIEEKEIDIICIGEGEEAICELAAAYPDPDALRTIRNLHFKVKGETVSNPLRPLVRDLDSLPFPDRDVMYKYPFMRRAGRKKFLAFRGCPYRCSFCFNHKMIEMYAGKGGYVRKRSSGNVISEINEVRRKYGLGSVFFQDEIFTLDKNWLLSFLDEYRREVSLPFTCFVRADLVDEETIKALRDSGCAGVQFGIEAGDEDIRNAVLRKQLTDGQIIAAAALLKTYRIKFKTYNILGLPKEDMPRMFKTAEINMRIRTDLPWASILAPYPQTDIAEIMKAEKLIPEDYDYDNLCSTFFDANTATRKDKIVLNFQRLFIVTVKFPFVFPIVKRLILLPPNKIFDWIFFLGQIYVYQKSEKLCWGDAVRMGYYYWKNNFVISKRRDRGATEDTA